MDFVLFICDVMCVYSICSAGVVLESLNLRCCLSCLQYLRFHRFFSSAAFGKMEDKTAAGTNNNAAAASNEAFRVVLASVTNLLYPVDIDLIHYLFSKYGEIEKVREWAQCVGGVVGMTDWRDARTCLETPRGAASPPSNILHQERSVCRSVVAGVIGSRCVLYE